MDCDYVVIGSSHAFIHYAAESRGLLKAVPVGKRGKVHLHDAETSQAARQYKSDMEFPPSPHTTIMSNHNQATMAMSFKEIAPLELQRGDFIILFVPSMVCTSKRAHARRLHSASWVHRGLESPMYVRFAKRPYHDGRLTDIAVHPEVAWRTSRTTGSRF